ncbi:hypothetical protein ACTG9Q_13075 [Actinokineospora sp. 24-640]
MRRRFSGSRFATVVTAGLAAVGVMVFGPAAQAEVLDRAAPGLAKETTGASVQASSVVTRGVWSCTLTASNPFRYWGGSGGGEQGIGSVNCSHVMQEMDLAVGLYRNGSLVAVGENYKVSAAFINAIATTSPHISATYYTGAVAAVRWPDGTVTQIPQVNSISLSL